MCLYVCVYIIYPRCAQPWLLYRDIYTRTHFSSSCGSPLSCRLTAVIPGAVSLVLALSCLSPLLLFFPFLPPAAPHRQPWDPVPTPMPIPWEAWGCSAASPLLCLSHLPHPRLLLGEGSSSPGRGIWRILATAGGLAGGGEELTVVPCPLGRSRGSH